MLENTALLLFGMVLGIVLMAYVRYLDLEKERGRKALVQERLALARSRKRRAEDVARKATAKAADLSNQLVVETARADMYETAFRGEMLRQVGWLDREGGQQT